MFDMALAIGLIVAMVAMVVLICADAISESRDDHSPGGRVYPPKDQGRPW